jgi:chemotaxis protein methyltransferase CheR
VQSIHRSRRRERLHRAAPGALPEGPFHLILCPNLAFNYLDEDRQRAVLRGIVERLVAGGYLLLGAGESLPEDVPDLIACCGRPGLWRKRADA